MENQEVYFCGQGRHESFSGYALIVPSYKEGLNAATDFFANESPFTTRNIIITDSDRDGNKYSIYENYQDSGSNDYFYFAVKIDE